MDEERPQFLPPRGVSRQLWEESPDGTSVPVWAPKRQFPHWRLGNFLLRKNPGIAPREALKMAYLVYAIFQRLNPSVYGWVQSLIEENGWEGTSRFLRKIFLALHQAGGGEKYFISGPHWVGGDNSVVVDFKVDCDQEEITWEVEFLPAYDEEAGKVTYLPGETYDWGEIPVVGKKGEEEEEADRILSLLIRRLDRWMSKVFGGGLRAKAPSEDTPFPKWAEKAIGEVKNPAVACRVRRDFFRYWKKSLKNWQWSQYETAARNLDGRRFYAAVKKGVCPAPSKAWAAFRRVRAEKA